MAIEPGSLGIQTYSFRCFTALEIPRMVRACGLGRVELCTMQFNLKDEAQLAALVAAYRDAGVAIDAFGVHGLGSADDERICAFAKRVGATVIGCDAPAGCDAALWRAAERLAERYDLRFAIHNHGGTHWLGSAQMLEKVFASTGERIGLCLDTAWAMQGGEDPLAMVRRFGKRLYGLHVKDFTFAPTGRVRDVVIGQGNLDLRALAQALDEVRFAGYAALEYEGEPEDPSPAINACRLAAHEEFCHV
jgi:inosose dehydratase